MADGGSSNDNNSWENWLGGWVQTAKEKSNTALEFVKKDLAEFTCTLQKETEKAVEKTSSSLTKANTEEATSKFKAGISSFFDNISKALVIPPDDDNYVPMTVSADGTTLYDRGKARLHALQLDAGTYLDPPRGAPEQFTMWLESFDMEQHKGDISELLVSKVEVRALYTKLVPNDVSHAEFWQRYFYRVHQLQCDEARKQALMQRADQPRGDSLSWDDDWSGGEEEEDDGNQSDWEKLPRPPQSVLAEKPKKSVEESSAACPLKNSSLEEKTMAPPKPEESDIQSTKSKSLPSSVQAAKQEDSPMTNDISDTNSDSVLSGSAAHSKPMSSAEPCLIVSASTSRDEAVGGSHQSQTPPDLLSQPTPSSDTACASHSAVVGSEDDTSIGVGEASVQQGSSHEAPAEPSSRLSGGDARQEGDALSGAAAAASVELPSSNNAPQNLTAEGACGVDDMVDSSFPPQSSNTAPQHVNLDIPAASSSSSSSTMLSQSTSLSSSEATNKTVEERLPESVESIEVAGENTPHTVEATTNVAPQDAVSTEAGQEVQVQERVEEAAATTRSQPESLTVETSNLHNIQGEVGPPEIGMRVKGDMVVVGERGSPSTDTSDSKDLGLDEDWEQDFDVEVTEEDLKAAEDIAKKLGENLDAEDDDWENWE